jgi:hypothetical protein
MFYLKVSIHFSDYFSFTAMNMRKLDMIDIIRIFWRRTQFVFCLNISSVT